MSLLKPKKPPAETCSGLAQCVSYNSDLSGSETQKTLHAFTYMGDVVDVLQREERLVTFIEHIVVLGASERLVVLVITWM